jgi:RNA polymerase sigma factor (sigma-70 family)
VADLDLRHAIAALTPHKRACVVLRYLSGMTEVQTAQILGVSPGTVKSQTHKALRQLREYLAEPADEAGQIRTGEGHR